MQELRAICARLPQATLIAAECENLTGGRPDADGVASCLRLGEIEQSAFVNFGLRCLAEANTLDELAHQTAEAVQVAERFHIDCLQLTPRADAGRREAILAVARLIPGYPDLSDPQRCFKIVLQEQRLWCGEILAKSQHSYRKHDTKPYRTSSSLPSRLSRAIVNLVAPPAKTILDPFCGTGSILLEAQALGLSAFGMDINPKMVYMSRRNMAHYGYNAAIECGDAAACQVTADAIVTDLPYGVMLKANRAGLPDLLKHTFQLAPVAIYLVEQDISSLLQAVGYQQIDVFPIRKNSNLIRYVHRARVDAK